MEIEYYKKLKEKISKLSNYEKGLRDIYLSKIGKGELLGPTTGYASIDKPWLKYYDERKINTSMPKMSCFDYLCKCNKKYLNRMALRYFGRGISFDTLFMNIEMVSKALKEAGVQQNDIITISLPNIPEAVYLFYACSKIGAIANMVDPRTSEEGIKKYIEEVDSKLVIIIDSYFYKVKELINSKDTYKAVVISPSESLPIGLKIAYKAKERLDLLKKPEEKIEYNDKISNYSNFISKGKGYENETRVEHISNKPFIIEHTGGTTGDPKGVVLSNENINAVALQSVLTGINMRREHTWLDIMPTFIAYGVGMGLHLPLTIGMETILIPKFDAKKFDELILKYRPIHMVGVPSYFGTMINSKKMVKVDLSFMINPTAGGDAMDVNLEKNFNEFLKKHNCSSKITKGYGMTEVAGGLVGTLDESNAIGSVGSPFVKSNVAIFDPITNEELGYNELGEVCMQGPSTMLGYFKNPIATNDILKVHGDGTIWVHSGDCGYITEDGNLFIVDRYKRMIIRYDGFKVFPSVIENIIVSHRAVDSCKVVAISDIEHSQGKLPKAHIILKPEFQDKKEIIIKEVKQLCLENLPEYMQPYSLKVRENFPLTKVGKIDYRALEEEEEKSKVLVKK